MDRDDHTRLKLTAAMQELMGRLQRGSLDSIPEVPPERPRHKFGLIQGGKAGAIILGAGTGVRWLREHGAAVGTAAAIAAGAAVVYGITAGPDQDTAGPDIGAEPPSIQLSSEPATPPAGSAEPTPGIVDTTTTAAPTPAPVIVPPTTTAEIADPIGTPRPTPTSILPVASPTGPPSVTAWPTPSANPTPTAAPTTTAPTATPEPTPTPTAAPTPGPGEPPDQGPRLCLRVRPILRICVGR